MRTIQFRGKSAATCDWIYGYLVTMPDGISGYAIVGDHFKLPSCDAIGTEEYCEVLNDTIGQYSGLTDYRNNPVFEGDIIETEGAMGIVRYGNHAPGTSTLDATSVGFYIEWLGELNGILRNDIGFWLDRRTSFICGNIYDNPGLLEA